MSIYLFRFLSGLFIGCTLLAACSGNMNNPIKTISAQSDTDGTASKSVSTPTPQATAKGEQTVVFAGGCFWGVEAVFEHVKGVSSVTSGFAGGAVKTANQETVGADKNGHAEAVKITYDPSKVTYQQLLKVFFLVAHDPTQLNRQGPDVGTQYRSAIFYASEEQNSLPKVILPN